MTKKCEYCIDDYAKKIRVIAVQLPRWKELDNIELLLAIGEELNHRNMERVRMARLRL